MTLVEVLATFLVAAGAYALFKSLFRVHPYHDVPVPKRESWMLGNGDEGSKEARQTGSKLIDYSKQFDSDVFLLPEPVGADSLVIGDPALLNFVLSDVRKFPSTPMRSAFVRFVIGDGLVSAPPKEHAKQRRIMGPAFTQAHIVQLAPVFTEKAEELSKKIALLVKQGGQPKWSSESERGVINITELLDSVSFDIIGKAGFGVDFQCLAKGQENVVLAKGYNRLLQASVKFDFPRIILMIAAGLFEPKLLGLPINNANRTIIQQNKQLQEFTSKVIAEKIKRISVELDEGIEVADKQEAEDLVESIIRINLQMERKEMAMHGKAHTMSAKELEGQIQTLLFAGYETSSVITSMCLHYLAHNQPVQNQLRKELKAHLAEINADVTGEDFRTRLTYDELQSPKLALLQTCIKETLRLAPPVTISQRTVTEDCVGPLTRPIPTRDGKGTKTQIVLKKGTRVGCSFKLASMNPLYWGPSPEEWNPSRWDNLPEAYKSTSMPGPAGLPAFSNGPASCIGARFALLEITALLVGVLPHHRFEPSSYKVIPKQVLVLRPTVIGQDVAALPLKVTTL